MFGGMYRLCAMSFCTVFNHLSYSLDIKIKKFGNFLSPFFQLNKKYRTDVVSANLQEYSGTEKATLSKQQSFENTERSLKLYGDAVLRAAYTYLHNMHDAEDIVQETFLRLFKSDMVFVSAEHEKAWLLRVAINLSKNKLKSAWFRRNKLQADDFDNAICGEDGDSELKFVWEAVKSLPIKYREVIHLFYQEGFSTAEIANILEKNESTVRSLLSRGRKLLREILREEYDFDE